MSSFLLIHGAYQGGWIWRRLAVELRADGHEVHAPTLDGCAYRSHQLRAGITTETHASELAELMRFEELEAVTIVATSTGGMVLCRLAELARERIARLIFVDALALFDGERLSDVVTRRHPVTSTIGTRPSYDDARDRLFAELDVATRQWALERYTAHPIAVMEQAVVLENFWCQAWNARVIWCRDSQNPSRSHQRRAAQALQADWCELDSGHYPMLQCPKQLRHLLE